MHCTPGARVKKYSRFATQELALLETWSTGANSNEAWTLGNPIGFGESQSKHVTSDSGIRGIAKPAFQPGSDMPRAAHEKIASDLAFMIGVPVPPVTLWTNPSDSEKYAISGWAFRQPLNFDQALGVLTQKFRENMEATLAAGYVFHTWIDDTDHGGNGGNVLVDSESTDEHPGIAFIDHAFSMTYTWTDVAKPCSRLSSYYMMTDKMPPDAIADVVNRVQSIPESTILEIVDRIPVVYLTSTRAKLICECLVKRQSELGAAFGI
jgi:hypothetical protein